MQDILLVLMIFFEGVASFLSPCVLPLIPVYMGYLTGQTVDDLMLRPKSYKWVGLNAVAFVLGFSFVFIAMGAAASSLGSFFTTHRDIIRKISGALIVFFGLFHTGILPIGFLNREKRFSLKKMNPGIVTSILVGFGFGLGWTPCIGPMLASALILAGQADTIAKGIGLLAVYSAGLGLPFIVLAFGIKVIWNHLRKLNKYINTIRVVSGALLIVVGVLIFFNKLNLIGGI